jgi:hypothetical protein
MFSRNMMLIGTSRQPMSRIRRTPTRGGSKPSMDAANITRIPLVPVMRADREHTKINDASASSLEQRRPPSLERCGISRSIADLDMIPAMSIDNSNDAINPRLDSHWLAPSADPRNIETASIEPLLARMITKSAPTANTAPDADIDEYNQMKRMGLAVPSSHGASRTFGEHTDTDEPDVIPGIHPTIVPPSKVNAISRNRILGVHLGINLF